MLQLEGELYNGRVAMLAVVGILTVEALGRGPWWQAYNTVSFSTLHVSKKCNLVFVILLLISAITVAAATSSRCASVLKNDIIACRAAGLLVSMQQ